MKSTFPSRKIVVVGVLAALGFILLLLAGRTSQDQLQDAGLAEVDAIVVESPSMLRVIPPVRRRVDIGTILEEEGFKVGVELGVQTGAYSEVCLCFHRCNR